MMKRFRLLILISFISLGWGCSPNSLKDFHHEGEALSRALASDLREIHTKDDLIKATPLLKKRFEAFVELMIIAKEYQQKHLEEEIPEAVLSDLPSGESLFWELKRIYAMEGGRETIEKAQREALIRLDAYERNRLKQNQILHK
jgi:hypothetical protein